MDISMHVGEKELVCLDRSMWKAVLGLRPQGKRAYCLLYTGIHLQ